MEKDDTDKNGSLRKEQRAKNRFIKTSFDTNGDGNKWLQNGLAQRRPALDETSRFTPTLTLLC
jgi:hypothetical protein